MKNTKKKNNRNSAEKKNIVCIQRQYNCSTNKNWCGLIKSLLFIHDEQQRENAIELTTETQFNGLLHSVIKHLKVMKLTEKPSIRILFRDMRWFTDNIKIVEKKNQPPSGLYLVFHSFGRVMFMTICWMLIRQYHVFFLNMHEIKYCCKDFRQWTMILFQFKVPIPQLLCGYLQYILIFSFYIVSISIRMKFIIMSR